MKYSTYFYVGKGLMGIVRIARVKEKKLSGYCAIKMVQKSYIEKHKDQRHINFEREILMSMKSSFAVKVRNKEY